jgi:hypothetical protein
VRVAGSKSLQGRETSLEMTRRDKGEVGETERRRFAINYGKYEKKGERLSGEGNDETRVRLCVFSAFLTPAMNKNTDV